MTFIRHDVEQRSEAWYALRCGRLTASRMADMFAMTVPDALTPTGRISKAQPKELAGRRNLRTQLVLERLTGRSQERQFQSQAMLDGIEREEAATGLYEAQTGILLQRVGFVSHPELLTGASPDGIVGDWEEFVEVKSPIPATHLDYLETGKVPDDYVKQMRHLAWLTDMRAGTFVSFQPDFPESLRLKVVRLTFTADELTEHGKKVRAFLEEVDAKVAALKTMFDLKGTLAAAVA